MKKKQILEFAENLKKITDLPFRYIGDPILRQKCTKIKIKDVNSKEVLRIARKLIKTLKKYRKLTGVGRGLAAPEVGETKRIVVVWGFGEKEPRIMINPQITWRSKELASYPESCISSLSVMVEVIRPWQIKIQYYDLEGKRYQEKLNPQHSRLLQHEIDHLDGILCTDRGDPKTMELVFDVEARVKKGKFKLVKVKPRQS